MCTRCEKYKHLFFFSTHACNECSSSRAEWTYAFNKDLTESNHRDDSKKLDWADLTCSGYGGTSFRRTTSGQRKQITLPVKAEIGRDWEWMRTITDLTKAHAKTMTFRPFLGWEHQNRGWNVGSTHCSTASLSGSQKGFRERKCPPLSCSYQGEDFLPAT